MRRKTAEKILFETERGYDLVFKKFSDTRKEFWKGLGYVRKFLKDEDKVFDFGCGNGRLLPFLREEASISYWGADISGKLIEIAREINSSEKSEFLKINPSQQSLAFDECFFNAVYSIAVFHHLPSKKMRLELAKELFRVIEPGGYIVITVWNLWQKNYRKNIFKNWKNKIFGKSDLDFNDCYISFTDNQGNVFQRYHHAFRKNELKCLFEKAGFETESCKTVEKKNIVYIGKR